MKKNKFDVKTINTMMYVMFGVMTMIALYMTFVMQKVSIIFYILSSFFIMGILCEDKPLAAILMYIIVSGAVLLLLPIPYTLPYIMLFGHYGIAKYYSEKIKDKVIGYVARLLYFNLFCMLVYFCIIDTGYLSWDFVDALPIWALILILQPCFVLYDAALNFVRNIYEEKLRKRLL